MQQLFHRLLHLAGGVLGFRHPNAKPFAHKAGDVGILFRLHAHANDGFAGMGGCHHCANPAVDHGQVRHSVDFERGSSQSVTVTLAGIYAGSLVEMELHRGDDARRFACKALDDPGHDLRRPGAPHGEVDERLVTVTLPLTSCGMAKSGARSAGRCSSDRVVG